MLAKNHGNGTNDKQRVASPDVTDELSLSKEEKLRLRQEKWKKKKQALAKTEEAKKNPEEEKKRLRREKLEAWKKKKENELQKAQAPLGSMSLGGKRVAKRSAIRSIFGDEDEDSSTKRLKVGGKIQFKKKAASTKIEEDVDDLDTILSEMQSNETKEDAVDGIIMNENEEGTEINDEADTVEEIVKKIESKKSLQKKLVKVNHEAVKYESFRRDFYNESAEIKALSKADVELLRTQLDGIKIRGLDPPAPVTSWSQLGLSASYLEVLMEDLKFALPTPIQAQSIPAVLKGRDVIGIAKTGSGKSLSFILPLFRHIRDRKLGKSRNPLALILVPTRELAVQSVAVAKKIDAKLKSVGVYGGENISKQIKELGRGVDLIVATPGRLIDILSLRKVTMREVTFLVIDEADRMFDMGFQPQINMIIDSIRPDAQKVLFSATFPGKLEALAKNIMKRPLEIKIGLKGVNEDIKQVIKVLDSEDQKFFVLLEVLGEFFSGNAEYNMKNDTDIAGEDNVLVFVGKQESADLLGLRLESKGYSCEVIHGGRSQVERVNAINNFKSGKKHTLVATSIAARGLDVNQLKLVVNYDCPNHIEDYIHRIGRTGRAGSKGVAVSLLLKSQERSGYDILRAMKLSNVAVPPELEQISGKFLKNIKEGKTKFFSGFGGKGLEKLDKQRDEKKETMRQKIGVEPEAAKALDDGEDKAINSKVEQISDFVVHEGKASDSPDAGVFHSKINVNDLPQSVRWKVTNRETIGKIIDESSCSITTKGMYYKAVPAKLKEPKLYMLVEGETNQQVAAAVALIKESIIQGMKEYSEEETKTGRYVVA